MREIVFEDVSVAFDVSRGRTVALDSISTRIEPGEFVTIVGPSGCGKTTLLNAVAGLVQPTSGRIVADGRVVEGPGPERGVIFQQYALFPWLTVQQNVEFGLRVMKIPPRERAEIALRRLGVVGLADFANALPKELSGGMKQRCAIARAYAVDPAILLMDEPFGALDALARTDLQTELLRVWQQDRKTVIFVTHDVEEAVYLGNRVVVMSRRPGRIKEIIEVPFDYPRSPQLRLSSELAELRKRVWRSVEESSLSAQRGTAQNP